MSYIASYQNVISQITGPFDCEICSITFNSREDLDATILKNIRQQLYEKEILLLEKLYFLFQIIIVHIQRLLFMDDSPVRIAFTNYL